MSSTATDIESIRLRYPIGPVQYPEQIATGHIQAWIQVLENLPADLRDATEDLTDEQLETPYRPGGWTVRQVVHHLADSHINSYVRVRRALTEENPNVSAYDENIWAQLPDARSAPIDISLRLLGALHARWTALFKELTPGQWKRTYNHSEMGAVPLDKALALYAWHGRHHLAHITTLRERMGW
jgi:uncharacterized damage-inducible protein DinB